MEPEGSLPYSQQPANCPYPEQDRSSPWSHPTSVRSVLILSSIYSWVFQVVSFPQVFPVKPCMHLSSVLYVLHALPIWFFLTWSPEWYLLWSIQHEAPCHVVLSTLFWFYAKNWFSDLKILAVIYHVVVKTVGTIIKHVRMIYEHTRTRIWRYSVSVHPSSESKQCQNRCCTLSLMHLITGMEKVVVVVTRLTISLACPMLRSHGE